MPEEGRVPLAEPAAKRAIAFFDGQNLFHAACEAFGHTFPNFDPLELALTVASRSGWQLEQVRFYVGAVLEHQRCHRVAEEMAGAVRSVVRGAERDGAAVAAVHDG